MNQAKNHLYLKLSHPKRYLAIIGITGSLMSSLSGSQVPMALADEGAVNSSNAFLTVQPITLEEKDGGWMFWQNDIFVVSSQIGAIKIAVPRTSLKTQNKVVVVTAYSSTADQTDSSPFITANGTYVYDGIIATNFLPFGTKVKFPEYSGDKIYTVEDRMAKKNSHKIDIWMPTRQAALNFGVKKLAYEIVE